VGLSRRKVCDDSTGSAVKRILFPKRSCDDACPASGHIFSRKSVPKNEVSAISSILVVEEREMSDEEKTVSITCQRCGRCCKEEWWLWEGYASIQDIAGWIATRRYDILDWVDPVVDPCTHEIVFDIWISPRTHDDVSRCPWFRKQRGSDLYGCLIHDVKPIACREWPSNIADAQKIGCPACQDIFPCKTGQVIEFHKKHPDECE
jgi:Fe-S-cluster containining protein